MCSRWCNIETSEVRLYRDRPRWHGLKIQLHASVSIYTKSILSQALKGFCLLGKSLCAFAFDLSPMN